MIIPTDDGTTHINIYSKGKTELGRLLSNFAHTPFEYGSYGSFASVEGFWYYYLTGLKHEHLRHLHGFKAKEAGKALRDDREDVGGLSDENKEVLLEAIRCKLRQHARIRKLMRENTLPYEHYYCYGSKVIELPQYQWIVDEFTRITNILRMKK